MLVIVFLCFAFAIVGNVQALHSLEEGDCSDAVTRHNPVIAKNHGARGYWFNYQIAQEMYRTDQPIACIKVMNNWNDGTGGETWIRAGGVHYSYVEIQYQSQLHRGYSFTTHIWVNPPKPTTTTTTTSTTTQKPTTKPPTTTVEPTTEMLTTVDPSTETDEPLSTENASSTEETITKKSTTEKSIEDKITDETTTEESIVNETTHIWVYPTKNTTTTTTTTSVKSTTEKITTVDPYTEEASTTEDALTIQKVSPTGEISNTETASTAENASITDVSTTEEPRTREPITKNPETVAIEIKITTAPSTLEKHINLPTFNMSFLLNIILGGRIVLHNV